MSRSYKPINDDSRNMQILLETRAAELFKICDIESKGFINRKDIQRMREPLGVTPDILEEVFDTLDYDRNGFLTLDEFTSGFSSYLGQPSGSSDSSFSSKVNEELIEEDEVFDETMDALGAHNIVEWYIWRIKAHFE